MAGEFYSGLYPFCCSRKTTAHHLEETAMIFTREEVAIQFASRDNESLQCKNLVAAARSGSSTAFAELREVYGRRVYRKLLAITKNREDAEDALQDAFMRAYMALHTFEERASFYTWVTRIGINSALMILRRRRLRPEVSFDTPGETEEVISGFEIKDTGPSPEHICVHRQMHACMLRSIWKLQPRLRQVVELRMTNNCSIREIAQALDISESAVKSRLSRARARLASTPAVSGSSWDAHVPGSSLPSERAV
jgi:RNA polymerase sigma-70 factor (ECF subfamily)